MREPQNLLGRPLPEPPSLTRGMGRDDGTSHSLGSGDRLSGAFLPLGLVINGLQEEQCGRKDRDPGKSPAQCLTQAMCVLAEEGDVAAFRRGTGSPL